MNTEIKLVVAGVLVATATGCSTTPNWDARFGEPIQVITAQQVIAPEASLNRAQVSGMDGKAAQGVMSEYTKSYTQPVKQPDIVTIGVGSSGD